jgi:hypothetical protein
MTALLYYSYSRGLSENELVEIDKEVYKNRKFVSGLVKKLPSNSKRKAKRLCMYVVFMLAISQPLAPCAAVILPLPSGAIHRLSSIDDNAIYTNRDYPRIAPMIGYKVDKVRLTNQQIEQFDIISKQLISGSITMEEAEAILKIRGGGFYDWVTLAFIIYMFILQQGDIFQNVPLPHMDPMGWASGKYDSRNAGNG